MTLSEADRCKRAHLELSTLTRKFHKAGWVHGDLRTANFLAPEGWQQDVGARLLLVDFDWGGRVTEARFPTALLNPELCVREFKTFNDLFIRFEDDVKVLAATLGLSRGYEVDTSE
ncbi:hypothetical protein B0H11DRAFT_2279727 [Mycena galericulata]|nr:hypothetical protein B0H11DRAFT_2279727 [Mycena galericulata]